MHGFLFAVHLLSNITSLIFLKNQVGFERYRYRVSIDTHGIERYRVSNDTTVSLRDTAG
jgi:hypothetical protein